MMLLKNYKKHKEKQVKWCKSSDFAEMSGAFALFTELLFIVYLNIMYVHVLYVNHILEKETVHSTHLYHSILLLKTQFMP